MKIAIAHRRGRLCYFSNYCLHFACSRKSSPLVGPFTCFPGVLLVWRFL